MATSGFQGRSDGPGTVTAWVRWLLDSYARRSGAQLLERTGSDDADAEALWAARRVVLCHDGAADPRFTYANKAAADLWAMPVDGMVGMPSRLSAGPQERRARAAILARAADAGLLRGHEGIRTARDGRRFRILDATIWTVEDDAGNPVGQAATFERWEAVPD